MRISNSNETQTKSVGNENTCVVVLTEFNSAKIS